MAAEEFEKKTIFPIMNEADFEKHNNDVKELIEMFKEYEDGQESIDGLALTVYENYEAYKKEQEYLKTAYLEKMKGGSM
ncbi:MAG: hypothetical protein GY760_03115 [Deltaproteobacteria bacterium]|nr:hypothetical protein [Deltaproteobacteria bacterium]